MVRWFGVLVLGAALLGCGKAQRSGGASKEIELLNVSYDPTRELWRDLKASLFDLLISAEIPAERYAELGLKRGDTVYVSPRRARVFLPDYEI